MERNDEPVEEIESLEPVDAYGNPKRKREGNLLSDRVWARITIVASVLSFGVGLWLDDIVTRRTENTPPSTSTFEDISYSGNGYVVERVSETEFEIIDTRPPGNVLQPDRVPHLRAAQLKLQEEGCVIESSREDPSRHTLIITLDDPECLRDALTATQRPRD